MSSNSSTKESPKLCITCKFCGTNRAGDIATFKCFAPDNYYTINLVDGSKQYAIPYCVDHRAYGSHDTVDNICGTEARWRELAPPRPVYESEVGTKQVAATKTAGMDLSSGVDADTMAASKAASAAKLAALIAKGKVKAKPVSSSNSGGVDLLGELGL